MNIKGTCLLMTLMQVGEMMVLRWVGESISRTLGSGGSLNSIESEFGDGDQNATYGACRNDTQEQSVEVGGTVNVFEWFGDLIVLFKVVPIDCNSTLLVAESRSQIFESNSLSSQSRNDDKIPSFDDYFLIDLCKTAQDLLLAFFSFYEIKGIWNTEKVFTALYESEALKADLLGIGEQYLDFSYSYILVRLYRREESLFLEGEPKLSEDFVSAYKQTEVGSSKSVQELMDRFGSHVISRYELGDVLYQVFVYDQELFQELNLNFSTGTTLHNSSDVSIIANQLPLSNATHVGEVQTASGCTNFSELLANASASNTSRSIFEILEAKHIFDALSQCKEHVITALTLDRITKYMTSLPGIDFFKETFDNELTLFEVNSGQDFDFSSEES